MLSSFKTLLTTTLILRYNYPRIVMEVKMFQLSDWILNLDLGGIRKFWFALKCLNIFKTCTSPLSKSPKTKACQTIQLSNSSTPPPPFPGYYITDQTCRQIIIRGWTSRLMPKQTIFFHGRTKKGKKNFQHNQW